MKICAIKELLEIVDLVSNVRFSLLNENLFMTYSLISDPKRYISNKLNNEIYNYTRHYWTSRYICMFRIIAFWNEHGDYSILFSRFGCTGAIYVIITSIVIHYHYKLWYVIPLDSKIIYKELPIYHNNADYTIMYWYFIMINVQWV